MRRKTILVALAAAALFVAAAAAVPTVRALVLALDARRSAQAAETAAGRGRFDVAEDNLAGAQRSALEAEAQLRAPAPALLARIPYLGRTLRAAKALAGASGEAAAGARELLRAFPERSPVSAGRVDYAAISTMRERFVAAEPYFATAARTARTAPGSLLLPPVGRIRARIVGELDGAARAFTMGGDILQVLPAMLGRDGGRRYFLVAQNSGELRATGGFWGSYGIIEAAGGQVRLTRTGSPSVDFDPGTVLRKAGPDWYQARYGHFEAPSNWRSINLAPDFPTVAALAEQNFAEAAGGPGPVDGVIAIDPLGLAALMSLTGPVSVQGWDEPITAGNVVAVTLHDAYVAFGEKAQRFEFLGDVAQAVWAKLLTSNLSFKPAAFAKVGDAIRDKHILLHFSRADEQRLVERGGAQGSLGDPARTIGLVTQNAAGNKIDYWLRRSFEVTLHLLPDRSADADVVVRLRNDAPSSGEPRYLIGPYDERFRPGLNRQLVSIYLPRGTGLLPGYRGRVREPILQSEMGLTVATDYLDAPAKGTGTARYRFNIPDVWDPPTGELRVTLRRQPTIAPDAVRLVVDPPLGWRATGSSGSSGWGRWYADVVLETDRDLRIRIGRSALGRIVSLVPVCLDTGVGIAYGSPTVS